MSHQSSLHPPVPHHPALYKHYVTGVRVEEKHCGHLSGGVGLVPGGDIPGR